MMKSRILASCATAVAMAICSDAASMTLFSPATGAVAVLGAPVVALGMGVGSVTFGSTAAIFATTGSLTSASGNGTATGTVNFSEIVGAIVQDSLTNFMVFNDTSGGQFDFNVSSAETLAFTNTDNSTSVTLYLLGMASDSHLGLGASPTSETLTFNKTGPSAYSASATIASPPSGVPEPAGWALMMVGFGLAGFGLRSRRKIFVSGSKAIPNV